PVNKPKAVLKLSNMSCDKVIFPISQDNKIGVGYFFPPPLTEKGRELSQFYRYELAISAPMPF
ncbi:MAG: hypothetical protein KI786_12555, partial [Mameliella sp.]|nr:hypothetical protein [Phaeodactylibacter sp.]